MKRTSMINLSIITGLLALCVMTLIAVYAMGPESSAVLLFEDNLNILDETKWEHLVSKCEGNGSQFHYSTADQESGNVKDRVLHLSSTVKEENLRSRRAIALTPCPPCNGSENGDIECVPTLFKLQTRNLFLVRNGRLEVRAKLPKPSWTTYFIGILPNATHAIEEKPFNELYTMHIINNGSENETKEIRLSLGLDTNHSTVHRNVSSEEFHVFEIEWTGNKITFKIDSQVIFKKVTEFSTVRNKNSLRRNGDLITHWALKEPFYLSLGVGVEEKHFQNSDQMRSSSNSTTESPVGEILEVDYIRLFEIS